LNCSIKFFLRSTVNGIGASNRLVPEIKIPRAGSKNLFLVYR
jgi:hypothetical protein